jgi:hypothetical protein
MNLHVDKQDTGAVALSSMIYGYIKELQNQRDKHKPYFDFKVI